MPSRNDFEMTLDRIIGNAKNAGLTSITVRSGDLHMEVGDYPGPNNRMPICCSVMRSRMRPSDEIIEQPPKGNGANLVIKYFL
jgi:hypothetical protein